MAADDKSQGQPDGGEPRDPRSYAAEQTETSRKTRDGEIEGGDGKPDEKPTAKKKGLMQRPVTLVVLIVAGLALVIGGVMYWLHARQFQSTDDAFVDTHLVRLAPRIAGRVSQVLVEDNQRVTAGQAVILLDPDDQQTQIAQTQAQKAQAQAQIEQANATLTQDAAQVKVAQATYTQNLAQARSTAAQATDAARDLARYLALKALNASAVSQQQLDQAEAQAQSTAAQRDASVRQAVAAKNQIAATAAQAGTARAQIAAGQAQVAAADAQIRSARLQLGYDTVVAPEAGTVAQRSVAIGAYVNPGAQIMAIVPLKTWVTANFKETQLAHMRPGQAATLHIDACPDADVKAHVDSIQRGSGQAFGVLPPENATGNFVKVVQRVPVKIVIDRAPADCPLGPGLSVEAKVQVR